MLGEPPGMPLVKHKTGTGADEIGQKVTLVSATTLTASAAITLAPIMAPINAGNDLPGYPYGLAPHDP